MGAKSLFTHLNKNAIIPKSPLDNPTTYPYNQNK